MELNMKTRAAIRNLQIWQTIALLIILFVSLFASPQTAKAAIPAGYSEYYIPGSTNQLFQILKDIDNDPDIGNALGGGGEEGGLSGESLAHGGMRGVRR
jgi:hypothetical protein